MVDIEDGLARILIGGDDEEWFFPLEILPTGTVVGTAILFTVDAGRYTVLGLSRSSTTSVGRSIEDRMARPLNLRRTSELRASDLRPDVEPD
ncbi:MAG: hypothetical protein H0U26_00190 [Acidimicrobiia bacterium]|nr:hypothetical protein [Acidimicrobiia bacterium]